jgi:hypothetical protein
VISFPKNQVENRVSGFLNSLSLSNERLARALGKRGLQDRVHSISSSFVVLDDLDGHGRVIPQSLIYLREGAAAEDFADLDVVVPQVDSRLVLRRQAV